MRKYKVRFHLGQGPNFMHWRIENKDTKDVQFLDPKDVELKLSKCRLVNYKKNAEKIYNGGHKTVVAWIECESVSVHKTDSWNELSTQVRYNPRVTPHWMNEGKVVDKQTFDVLFTASNRVYKPIAEVENA